MSDELTEAVRAIRDVLAWDLEVGGDALPDEIRDDLRSVLSAAVPHSAPTTAQDGPETLRSESGGVSGDVEHALSLVERRAAKFSASAGTMDLFDQGWCVGMREGAQQIRELLFPIPEETP